MDPRQLDALAQRLVQNPQDADALNAAYQHGQTDPRGYALFLEKVAGGTSDATYAAHWFNEAATVWTASLNDAHRAARALMSAVDRDPTYAIASDRLTELYRQKKDLRGVAALLERRTQNLAKLLPHRSELRAELVRLYGELGRVWSEELSQPAKAIAAYKSAVEHDPQDALGIYQLRELLKTANRWAEAIPYFEAEQRLIQDEPERSLALYQDEAEVCRAAGKLEAAAQALRKARVIDPDDPVLKQRLAATTLERIQARAEVAASDREEAARLFIELAETYGGEHGYSYSACALECEATNDRAAQLLMFYGAQLERALEGAPLLASYLRANPSGAVAADARAVVAQAVSSGQGELLDALEPPADAAPSERVPALLEVARGLLRKAKKREALAKYVEVLDLDPGQVEAVEYVEQHLRQGRKFAQLRDLLSKAADAPGVDQDKRVGWLQEVASLCEGQLRDMDGAIEARRRLMTLLPTDETAAEQLQHLLEKAARWEELARLLESRAASSDDLEVRLAWEKQAAGIHADKLDDSLAAAEAWARIAAATPEDPAPVQSAVAFFEKAERLDRAAEVVTAALEARQVEESAQVELGAKLGALKSSLGDWIGAGEAFSEAASLAKDGALWESAEGCFVRAQAWEQAAGAVSERIQLTQSPVDQAALCAIEAEYLERLGDEEAVEERLERATELDPASGELSARLEARFEATGRIDRLVALLLGRAERLAATESELRVALRKRAALLQRDHLQDSEGMRQSLLGVLEDEEDPESLRLLIEHAAHGDEYETAVELLGRLVVVAPPEEQVELALRQAAWLVDPVGDLERAIDRYRWIHSELASGHQGALRAHAELLQRIHDYAEAAEVFEQLLSLSEGSVRLEAARVLASIYENDLDQPEDALRVLEIVHGLDGEDFEAVERLTALSERLERWEGLVKYLRLLIEVEGDEEELSRMTLRLADVLRSQLDQPDAALEALAEMADLGDAACRDEYVELGDSLGRAGQVASKLVEWHLEEPVGPARSAALRGAFDRFVADGRSADALKVALELVRTKAVDLELAEQIEELATEAKHLDALSAAHDLLVRELSGPPRAEEMVRQAEVLSRIGVPPERAINHGEQGLSSVSPEEVEPLLERLVHLAQDDAQVIGIYERQVLRCKSPADRLHALGRAAEIAAERGVEERAREFFDVALAAGAQEEQIDRLLEQARQSDRGKPAGRLRRILAEACAAGGEGARDGGRTRSFLLGRAAVIARDDLQDDELAFQWLQDALVAYVDVERLEQLDALADAVKAPQRAAEVLGNALEQVFDGPLVRLLLAKRAQIREEKLGDKPGAAEDLKRLYELSPGDSEVAEQLEALYEELGDPSGLAQLYEDQILRSKDNAVRAELAVKVARLWEGELDDPREAADAWRRVLRMKSGDEEAKEGLARAKAAMLAKPAADPVPAVQPTPPQPPQSQARAESAGERAEESTEDDAAAGEGTHRAQPGEEAVLDADAPSDARAEEELAEAERTEEDLASATQGDEAVTGEASSPEERDEPDVAAESQVAERGDTAALAEPPASAREEAVAEDELTEDELFESEVVPPSEAPDSGEEGTEPAVVGEVGESTKELELSADPGPVEDVDEGELEESALPGAVEEVDEDELFGAAEDLDAAENVGAAEDVDAPEDIDATNHEAPLAADGSDLSEDDFLEAPSASGSVVKRSLPPPLPPGRSMPPPPPRGPRTAPSLPAPGSLPPPPGAPPRSATRPPPPPVPSMARPAAGTSVPPPPPGASKRPPLPPPPPKKGKVAG